MSMGGLWGETHGWCVKAACTAFQSSTHLPEILHVGLLFYFSLFYSFLLFFHYLTWAGRQGDRLVGGGWSFVPIITALFFFFFCSWVCFLIIIVMGCKSVLYGCLKLRFPDVEVNPGPRVAPQCFRVMFTNINGLHGTRDELAIAATKFDVVACAESPRLR